MEKWLTVDEVSELLKITPQAVRKNAAKGKYGTIKYEQSNKGGGKQGQALNINLANLKSEAQVKYFQQHQAATIEPTFDSTDNVWATAPQWKREIATKRSQILQELELFIAANPTTGRTELIKAFVKVKKSTTNEEKISITTIYYWQKAYRQYGITGLLPDLGKRSEKRVIDPEAYEFFMALYNSLQRRTVADCYVDLAVVAAKRGWRIPSLRTMQRIVQQDVPEAVKVLGREGKEAFRNKIEPYLLRDPDSIKGGQVWVGDHYRFDLFVKGPNGKPVRPWLTAWVDMRSRKFLGWVVSFNPSTDTIMGAFANAAMNKEIGLPEDIYIDNGRDYSSYEFAGRGHRKAAKSNELQVRSLIAELNINAHFAIPKNARAKVIERTFKIVAEKFCKRFSTYCGSDNKERPEGLEDILKTDAVPTVDEIRQAFDDWVQWVYNKTESDGQGRKGECPDETFARTRTAIRTTSESALRLCMMRHSKPLTVNRNGIKLFNNFYYDVKLLEYIKEKVYVRYRDTDLAKVFVFSLKDEFICEAKIQAMVSALGIDKEIIRQQNSIVKQVQNEAKAKLTTATLSNEEILKMVVEQKKATASTTDTTNIIQPIRVRKEINNAIEALETYEQKKAVGDNQVMNNARTLLYSSGNQPQSEDRASKAIEFLRIAQGRSKDNE